MTSRYRVDVHSANSEDAGWINVAHSPILGIFRDGDYARRWKGAIAVRMVFNCERPADGHTAWNPNDPAHRGRVELVWPPTRRECKRGISWEDKVEAAVARMQVRCDRRDRRERAVAARQEQARQIAKRAITPKGAI